MNARLKIKCICTKVPSKQISDLETTGRPLEVVAAHSNELGFHK